MFCLRNEENDFQLHTLGACLMSQNSGERSRAILLQNYLFKFFHNTNRVLSSLDPDQEQHSVSPDLGLNCLQKLSPDDKI